MMHFQERPRCGALSHWIIGGAVKGWLIAVAIMTLGSPSVLANEDDVLAWGRELFETRGCAACHTLAGVAEQADDAPNLTNLARRRFIAQGTLELTADNLALWLRNPQGVLPGSYMPNIWQRDDPERDAEIDALVQFLLSYTSD